MATLTVRILNKTYEQIGDDKTVRNDRFGVIVKEARRHAAHGVRCCIKWSRASDGQSGYWSPVSGATFDPYWFG